MWKRPSRRWEKSYRRPLIGLLIVSFQGLSWPMNSLSMCSCPSFLSWPMPSCGYKSSKVFRSLQPNGQRLCTRPKHRLIRFLIQLESWRMEISSIMIWSIWVHKRKTEAMIFMKIMSMSNPGYKKRIWPWVILREPLTRITICRVILSLMRRAKSYQPSRMLVMMSWIWDTTISWIQA